MIKRLKILLFLPFMVFFLPLLIIFGKDKTDEIGLWVINGIE